MLRGTSSSQNTTSKRFDSQVAAWGMAEQNKGIAAYLRSGGNSDGIQEPDSLQTSGGEQSIQNFGGCSNTSTA